MAGRFLTAGEMLLLYANCILWTDTRRAFVAWLGLQSEQVRQQMATTPSKDEDDWNTALDYMAAAAAGGVNMQFGRRDSNDISASLEPSLSQSLLLESSMSINEASRTACGRPMRPRATPH